MEMDAGNTGVSEQCVFGNINGFNVLEHFALDGLHDLAKGVCPYVVEIVIDNLVKTKVVTLDQIDDRIQTFNFSVVGESNKPPLIRKNKIKMSAEEMICFCR